MKYTILMANFLLLTHIYPPAVDGGSKVIAKMGEYLNKQGHSILAVTSNCTSTDDFSKPIHREITHPPNIISLPVITLFHRPFRLLGKFFPSFKTLSKGPIFKSLPLRQIINFHPDYIIAGPLPTTIIIYAKFIQLFTKSKLIINPCFHPQDPDFQTPLLLSLLKKSDYLWCLTNYEKKYFQKYLKIQSPQYIVHGLGVDTSFVIDKSKISFPKNPNILFIANFSAHKRTELLIQSFCEILENHPQTSLTLMGQKTLYFPKIQSILRNLPSDTKKKIKIIFKPTQEQIKKAIDNSTCLVLPSVHESFGLVFVESLARGKPIVAANTKQSSEVLNTLHGGQAFTPDNLSSLTNTILKLSKSPKLAKDLGLKGHNIVSKSYTWDKIGGHICKKLAI